MLPSCTALRPARLIEPFPQWSDEATMYFCCASQVRWFRFGLSVDAQCSEWFCEIGRLIHFYSPYLYFWNWQKLKLIVKIVSMSLLLHHHAYLPLNIVFVILSCILLFSRCASCSSDKDITLRFQYRKHMMQKSQTSIGSIGLSDHPRPSADRFCRSRFLITLRFSLLNFLVFGGVTNSTRDHGVSFSRSCFTV